MTSDSPGRRRLLVVTDDTENGGTAHLARQLALSLNGDFTVDFAANRLHQDDSSLAALRHAGLRFLDYPVSAGKISQQAYCLRTTEALIAESRPDVVLCVDSAVASLIALKRTAIALNIPFAIVVNAVSGSSAALRPFAADAKRCMDAAGCVVFVAKAHRLQLEQSLGRLAARSRVVRNFCSEAFFAPRSPERRRATRRALGITDGVFACLSAARITPDKGQLVTLRALDVLVNQRGLRGFHVLFAGGGTPPNVREIEDYIERRELGGYVTLLGERDDIADLLDASDCFVLPSVNEGAPLSIIEAMAKGVPVVASDVGDIAQMLDPSCGVLLPSPARSMATCVRQLADTLERFAADGSLAADMGRQARSTALARFLPSAVVAEYRKLLSDALRAAGPTPPRMSAGPRAKALARRRVVDFSDPRQAWNVLVNGWSECERGGIWTEGRMSTLQLDLSSTQRRITLRFVVKPFVNARWPRQLTTVLANGHELGVWDITRKGRQSLAVDVDLDRTGGQVEIQLVHGMAASPSALGLGDDDRVLSLRLKRLYVLPRRRSLLDAVRFHARRLLSVSFQASG